MTDRKTILMLESALALSRANLSVAIAIDAMPIERTMEEIPLLLDEPKHRRKVNGKRKRNPDRWR